ncbi:MAG: UvrD-helicase domain-containing protein [Candidatus Eremiobacteraeota bacterium]|nr:UvrD-helicase domain-containing protein [Candidatus Eremiobacteraeota bacterium]
MRLWVEASAGSGKTTDLIRTVVGLLAAGEVQLTEIAAITFTEKAAGELKLRLREALEAAGLQAALRQFELAQFATVHGFCQHLLQENPVEARIDPLFTVLDPAAAGKLFGECFNDWFQSGLQDAAAYPALARLQRRRFHPLDYQGRAAGLRPSLLRFAQRLADHRHCLGEWTVPASGWQSEMPALLVQLLDVSGGFHDGLSDWLRKLYGPVRLALQSYQVHQDGREQEACLCVCHKALRGMSEPGPKMLKQNRAFASSLYAWKVRLDAWKQQADADLMARLYQELQPLLEEFARRKSRMGRLDFLDLLLRTRELLQRGLKTRYRFLFVDEFQDTDPVQADIVHLLGQEGLYLVGDPKQAIYRFRRGDPAVYTRFQRDHQLEERHLDNNFRSRAELVHFLNDAFAPVFQADEYRLQAGYRPMEPQRRDDLGQPALLALPFEERPNTPTMQVIREEMARRTGEFLDWLLHRSGFQVCERGNWRPVLDRDVCLLFRAAAQNLDPILEELDARAIAHLSLSGRGLHQREEVAAVRTALEAIEWPQDRLSVFAALRGPLFGMDEPLLDAYFSRHGHFDPLQAAEEDDEVARALRLLAEMHQERNSRPAGVTLELLLERTGLRLHLAQWSQGQQRLANVSRIVRLAWSFEARGSTSFRAFVEYLLELAEEDQASEGLAPDEGLPGVRLLTVHSSKGLEFPVVILADPATAPIFTVSEASCPETQRFACGLEDIYPGHFHLYKEREEAILRAESDRLAYVAATRARDLLVVPRFSDRESWLAPLVRALRDEDVWRGSGGAVAPQPQVDPAQMFAATGATEAAAESERWLERQREIRARAGGGLKVINRHPFDDVVVEVVHLGPGGGNRDLGRRLHHALALELRPELAEEDLQERLRRVYASDLWKPGWREVPLTAPVAEGVVLEGVADLVFECEGVYTVVDFKSDGDRPEYHQQLAGYAYALKQATGAPVRAVLAVI